MEQLQQMEATSLLMEMSSLKIKQQNYGGAIYLLKCSLNIKETLGNTFSHNSALLGGVIVSIDSKIKTFADNEESVHIINTSEEAVEIMLCFQISSQIFSS